MPREIEVLKQLTSNIPTNVVSHPTREDILHSIQTHQLIHFACHGRIDKDPSQSQLLLIDYGRTPLTVSGIMSLNLQEHQFAYLSACNTARTKEFLHHESIHLVSALQLAGFPSIVGALWQVNDNYSVDVAKDVYEWILERGRKLDNEWSAEDLHRALCFLRENTDCSRRYKR